MAQSGDTNGPEPVKMASELENERRLDALYALQYRKSPLPDNRTANALVFIDGSICCDALTGYLSHENLELIRLVGSDETACQSSGGGGGPEQISRSKQQSFATPQFVATILLHDDPDACSPPSYRVHIFEPVSSSMTTCDSRLVDYFRSLVTNLLSRLTGRRLQVNQESFGTVKWHMCVSCLMECANTISFLQHAKSVHNLHLPQTLHLPSNCQEVAFGPLLVLRTEDQPQLHVLKTLVSLELTLMQDSPDFELETPIFSEDSQDSTEVTHHIPPPGLLPFPAMGDQSQLAQVTQLMEAAQQKQGQAAVLTALQSIINCGCERHPKHTQNCQDCSQALCQRIFPALDSPRQLGGLSMGPASSVDHSAQPTAAPITPRSNNKNLKCPLCNWTYKYRETREQHWREKHADLLVAGGSEADINLAKRACFHCRTNAPHPRLAKGEVYPCGFAAYHCHFCGYKTNTKGNLEIHKQSEKHLVNVQKYERQRSAGPRNHPGRELFFGPEAILAANAQMAEHQQRLSQLQPLPTQAVSANSSSPLSEGRLESVPTEFRDRDSLIRCFVCGVYATGSLSEMVMHLQVTRGVAEEEYIVRSSDPPNSISCRLCPYRSNVKANFSVHCSTEKHRLKVAFLAHILCGDRRLLGDCSDLPRRLSSMSSIQLLCTACQSLETSIISMERHLSLESHADAVNICSFVREREAQLGMMEGSQAKATFECRLCAHRMSSMPELRSHMLGPDHVAKITSQMPRSIGTSKDVLNSILNVSCKSSVSCVSPQTRLQCPCCTELLAGVPSLQSHLMKAHFIDQSRVAAMSQMATPVAIEEPAKHQSGALRNSIPQEVLLITSDYEHATADALLTERGLEEDQYRCQECTKCFALVNDLFEHQVLTNHEGNPSSIQGVLCWRKGCNQYFKSKTARLEHFKEIHARSYNEENSRFKFKCRVCGLFFANASLLQNHSVLHERLVEELACSHGCTLCHAKYISLASLHHHIHDVHTDDSKEQTMPKVEPSSEPASPPRPPPALIPAPTHAPAAPEPVLCRFCHISLANAEEFRVHERTPEHHNRIVAFALAVAKSCNPSVSLPSGPNLPPMAPLGASPGPGLNLAALSSLLSQANTSLQLPYQQQLLQRLQQMPPNVRPSPTLPTSKENEVETSDPESAQGLSARSGKPRTSPSALSTSPVSSPVTGGSSTPSLGPQLGLQLSSAPNSAGSVSSAPPPLGLVSPAFSDPPALVPGMISPVPVAQMGALGSHSFPSASPAPQNFNAMGAGGQSTPGARSEAPKRRGRTRISEEQLLVLRHHFHINSPPSDALIREISATTGLEVKVIKHWYRNTLFKERQRDKDSPYNFNVPPSTKLDMDEYERTGRVAVKDTKPDEVRDIMAAAGRRMASGASGPPPERRKRPLEAPEPEASPEGLASSPSGKRARLQGPGEEPEAPLTMAQLEQLMAFYKKMGACPSPDQLTAFAEDSGLSEQRVLAWIEKALSEDRHNLNLLQDEQIVAVRCPYCEIIFRLRSQLADHLKGAHPDQPPVDPASLPDGSARLGMSGALEAAPWISSPGPGDDLAHSPSSGSSAPRRSRTSISMSQSRLLRYVYGFTKNPSVQECLRLCHKLNLNRRVVQIWFQNRRANDKKRQRSSLGLTNFEPPMSPNPDDVIRTDTPIGCPSCPLESSAPIEMEHLFSDDHLAAIHYYIESAEISDFPDSN